MPRDSSGAYTLPSGNPVTTLTTIESLWANGTMTDLATAIGDSLDRSGRGAMLAQFKAFSGTALLPGWSWASETASGRYRVGAADFREIVNNLEVAKLAADGFYVVDSTGLNQFLAGYRDVPIVVPAAGAYQTVLSDRGKMIRKDDAAAITIPPNATVAYPLGAALSGFNNNAGSQTLTQGAGVTFRIAGALVTGNVTVAAYGMWTAVQHTADSWVVTGIGLS